MGVLLPSYFSDEVVPETYLPPFKGLLQIGVRP